MAMNGEELLASVRAGKTSLAELEANFTSAANNAVTIQDWGVCYSSGTGEMSEYCTVVATNGNNPITGIGMLAYAANGSQLYAAQYTNGFSSTLIGTSIGTTLFNPSQGNSVLCVVYGWTEQSNYYFTKTITIVPCQ